MSKFKSKKDIKLFHCLHPALILVFADMSNYAFEKHGIELMVTATVSTLAEDKKLSRTSSSHRTSRALDFRTFDIPVFVLDDIVRYINSKPEYKKYHYLSTNGSYKLAYLHNNGNGDHGHLAIHSKYSIDKPIKEISLKDRICNYMPFLQ